MCNSCKNKAEAVTVHGSQIAGSGILSHEIFTRYEIESGESESFVYDYINGILYNKHGQAETVKAEVYHKRKAGTRRNNDFSKYILTSIDFDKAGNVYGSKPEAVTIDKNILLLEFLPVCFDCGESLKSDFSDSVKMKENLYCDDCGEKYFICENCDCVFDNDEKHTIDGENYCDDCESELFAYCENCESIVSQDDIFNFNEQYLCEVCRDNISGVCHDCGNRELLENIYNCESDGEYYCENCLPSDFSDDDNESENVKKINLENNTFDKIKSKNLFGIELEIDCHDLPIDDIKEKTCFEVTSDGSLSCGKEFVSPILQGDKGFSAIENFCNVLGKVKTGQSSGFHLHVDASRFGSHDLKKIYLVYKIIEKYLFKILPASRAKNRYCQKSKVSIESIMLIQNNDDLRELWNGSQNRNGSRYHGFNLKAIEKHNTIELRYHSGTGDFEKIINWIKFNLSVFDFALKTSTARILELQKIIRQCENDFEASKKVFAFLCDDKEVLNYLEKRFLKFNPQFLPESQAVTVQELEAVTE